jgi:23S rRNA pseudouridine955/2504/2580 synthase
MNHIVNLDKTLRLDRWLRSFFNMPQSYVYRAIRLGDIRVNGKRTKAETRIGSGDCVRTPPRWQYSEPSSKVYQYAHHWVLPVLLETDTCVVVNKPSGLATQGGGCVRFHAVGQAQHQWPGSQPAHRLDKATSGCLLLGKQPASISQWHQAFAKRTVTKTYVALVQGAWPSHLHTINAPLGMVHHPAIGKMAKYMAQGKEAITHVLKRYDLASHTLLWLTPETGRMHQIRAHCALVNHPIVNDQRYGDAPKNNALMLHAYGLSSDAFEVWAPFPSYWDIYQCYINLCC